MTIAQMHLLSVCVYYIDTYIYYNMFNISFTAPEKKFIFIQSLSFQYTIWSTPLNLLSVVIQRY